MKLAAILPQHITQQDKSIYDKGFYENLKYLIENLEQKDYKTIYLVLKDTSKDTVSKLLKYRQRNTVIIYKELTENSSGGYLVSLSPIIKKREKILTFLNLTNYDKDLLNVIDLRYIESRLNTAFITKSLNNKKFDKVYIHLKKNRMIKRFSRKEKTRYMFLGVILTKGSLYNWLGKRLYSKPNIINEDYIEILNDYISCGGRIYGYKV